MATPMAGGAIDRGCGSALPSPTGRRGRFVGGGGVGAHLRLLPQGDPRGAGAAARRGRAPRDGPRGGRGGARGPLPLPLLRLQAPLQRRGRGTYASSSSLLTLVSRYAAVSRRFVGEAVAEIRKVSRDSTLDPRRKAYLIQNLMTRKAKTEMMCMLCLKVQPVGPNCQTPSCNGLSMAKYYCSICKFFDDERSVYHCPFCNLCRLGNGLGTDFFHCTA